MSLLKRINPFMAAVLAALLVMLALYRFTTGFWNPVDGYRAGKTYRQIYPAIRQAQYVAAQEMRSGRGRARSVELADEMNGAYETAVFELLRVYPGGVVEARFVDWLGVKGGTVHFHPVLTETGPPAIAGWRCISADMSRAKYYFENCKPEHT